MVDAPEKIWIEQDDCPYFYEESELVEVGSPVTEYTRSDLATELEAENERLKHALEAEKKRADEAEALAESMSFTAAFIGANPPTDNLEYYKIWNECSEAIATAVCLDEDIHVRMAQVRALLKRHKDAIAAEAERDTLRARVAELAEVRQQYVDANEARIDAEAELAKVTDPNAVHVNMLRGTIAKPSVAQIKHLYGDAIADPAELTRLREENEQYRESAREQLVVVNTASSRIEELEAVVVKLREALKRFAEVAEWDIGDNESDSDTYHPMDPRYSVSGNISIGHLRRAHEVMEETDWIADKIRAQQTNDAALKGTTHEQG